jgi:2-polyprenyl-3-methyl-5-hydroxy-6-metoxy-1,4-benzoquinol methylase
MNNIQLDQITIADDQSHHLFNNKPLYSRRFLEVLKFHHPRLAAVLDKTGAYHINLNGVAAYPQHYLRTFGFYDSFAAVIDTDNNWFHISTTGQLIYPEVYSWCGNFQNGACVVRDVFGYYFHIDLNGKPLYKQKYIYVGDFKDGIATVQNNEGLYTHIHTDGNYAHNKWFYDLDIFHKGFARAKDHKGWFHIDRNGLPLYPQRYKMVEPFYNGFARAEDNYGAILIINEQGNIKETLRDALQTPLQQLSADLVGYWKTQTIKAAVELKIFDFIPNDQSSLVAKTGLKSEILTRLLRALQELNLIYNENNLFNLTEKGKLLQSNNETSLATAAIHWATEPYLTWLNLTDALKHNRQMYSQKHGDTLFEWLEQDNSILQCYQTAMMAYAKHDYKEIAYKVDLIKNNIVIDAGGGQGVLLDYILQKNTHLRGILLERAAVVQNLLYLNQKHKSFELVAFDLFTTWPKSADVIFLSRVLHDWDNEQCAVILEKAKEALSPNGVIYLVEMLLDEETSNGGMLDLNMLVLTGGMERTKSQFTNLVNQAGLNIEDIVLLSSGNYILKLVVNNKHE